MSAQTIRMGVDGRYIRIEGRRHGRRLVETFEARDHGPAACIASALRSARLLRPGGVRHLQVEMETPSALYQFLPTTNGPDISSLRATAEQHLIVRAQDVYFDVARSGPDTAGSFNAVVVSVARDVIDPIGAALERRRFDGGVSLELGPLARLRRLLIRLESDVRDRPGIVIDVVRTAVSVFELEGGCLRAARCMPRDDKVDELVGTLFHEAVESLPQRSHPSVRHPSAPDAWLHFSGEAFDEAGLARACAASLTVGSRISLARLKGQASVSSRGLSRHPASSPHAMLRPARDRA